MTNQTSNRSWLFWVIAALGLFWNIGGSLNYLMQTDPQAVARLPDSHRAIIDSRPWWATTGFALGVFAGAFGCLLLIMRKTKAREMLWISLIGIVVTSAHTLRVALSDYRFTLAELIVMLIMPVLVAIALLWYAHKTLDTH